MADPPALAYSIGIQITLSLKDPAADLSSSGLVYGLHWLVFVAGVRQTWVRCPVASGQVGIGLLWDVCKCEMTSYKAHRMVYRGSVFGFCLRGENSEYKSHRWS